MQATPVLHHMYGHGFEVDIPAYRGPRAGEFLDEACTEVPWAIFKSAGSARKRVSQEIAFAADNGQFLTHRPVEVDGTTYHLVYGVLR